MIDQICTYFVDELLSDFISNCLWAVFVFLIIKVKLLKKNGVRPWNAETNTMVQAPILNIIKTFLISSFSHGKINKFAKSGGNRTQALFKKHFSCVLFTQFKNSLQFYHAQ